MDSKKIRTAHYWGNPDNHNQADKTQWTDRPLVGRYVNERATGDPTVYWLDYLRQFLPPQPVRALSIACGLGVIERMVWARDICREVEGVDISEGAIAEAERLSVGMDGLTFRVADVETEELPPATYHLVIAHAALHHLFHLEHVLENIRRALKPAGILAIYDYVGPSQMQFPRAHLAVADAMLQTIPERYRAFRRWDGIKDRAPILGFETMNAADPSEAIRAREVVPLVAARFELLYARPLGGTLLQLVLNEIIGNFPPDDPEASRHLERLIATEGLLIDTGALPSYHAYLVCRVARTPTPMQTLVLPASVMQWI